MILTGSKIHEEYDRGNIFISPFHSTHIGTNSYDLKVGSRFLRCTQEVLDARGTNHFESVDVGSEGLRLARGDFVLGHSEEIIGSDHYVPVIHARSGIARLGLFVHITADLLDLGWHGHIPFQFYSTLPIIIFPGMRVAQLSFWKPYGKIDLQRRRRSSSPTSPRHDVPGAGTSSQREPG
jgi:dCTP deaminase